MSEVKKPKPEIKVTSAGEITEDGIMRNTPWNG